VRCVDCGVDVTPGVDADPIAGTWEYYMVHDEVWAAARMPYEGSLCVACLEVRLGRHLTPGDFSAWPINDWSPLDTPRLLDRKGLA
jgi:hypothetical protein